MADSISALPLDAEKGSDLGLRLKIIREHNGLSQRELAKRAGVPHSNISMIEQGSHSPSVNSLIKILNGIPMSVAHFFLCDINTFSQSVYRANELKQAEKVVSVGFAEQIIPMQQPTSVEFKRGCFAPLFDSGPVSSFKNTCINGYVVSGLFQVTINTDVSMLNQGDAFSLSPNQAYRFQNPSPTEECIIVLCEI